MKSWKKLDFNFSNENPYPLCCGALAFAFRDSDGPDINSMDHLSIVRGLLADIRSATPRTIDPATRLHLQDVSDRLKEALEPSK